MVSSVENRNAQARTVLGEDGALNGSHAWILRCGKGTQAGAPQARELPG